MNSTLEQELLRQIRAAGLPEPLRDFAFAFPYRRWKLDFAWQDCGLAIEVDGGSFVGGAHGGGQGAENDCMKAAVACFFGWHLLRVTTHMVHDGRALFLIRTALGVGLDLREAGARLAQTRCQKCDLTKTRRRQKARQRARECDGR